MKALVTGGAGFIGSHLCEHLLAQGHHVSIIDNLSTGSLHNISHLEGQAGFHYTIDTVLNKDVVDYMVKSCDCVFHLASAVGVKLIVHQPVNTIETIIGGTKSVLQAANRHHKKILITSTSEVYGKSNKDFFSEDDDCHLGSTKLNRWSYAASKAIDEFLALAYHKENKLPIVITRLFNTVGPRQVDDYGMVVPTFIKQALNDEPITVYGTGDQTRCFSCVFDIVDALSSLMNCPKAVGEVVNLGSQDEITINGLAQKIIEVLDSKSDIIHIPYHEAYEEGFEDMQKRRPAISLAQKLIDFNPSTTLEEIIEAVADHIKSENTL